MKIKLILITALAVIQSQSFSDELRFEITKKPLKNLENSNTADKRLPDMEFRIKAMNDTEALPDLVIPTYSAIRRRIVDLRSSKNRIEIAIQVDELGIGYFDYRLENGGWILKNTKSICSLNGTLAQALAQVDIRENGDVEVKFHNDKSGIEKFSWDMELYKKEHESNSKLFTERYNLKDDGFHLAGLAMKSRPSTNTDISKKELNKLQQPTDKTPVPEK